jgi:hypothetical protein
MTVREGWWRRHQPEVPVNLPPAEAIDVSPLLPRLRQVRGGHLAEVRSRQQPSARRRLRLLELARRAIARLRYFGGRETRGHRTE